MYSEIETSLPSGTTENDGAIGVSIFGGNEPFTFLWTGPNNFSSTEQNIDNLGVGIYTLEMSDPNGNSDQRIVHLSESFDSTLFEYPIDTTFLTSQDTCIYYSIEDAFVYNYYLLQDSIEIQWAFIGNDLQIQFVTVTYPYSYTEEGIYGFSIDINCENNKAISRLYQTIYINPNLTNNIQNHQFKSNLIYPNPSYGKFYFKPKEKTIVNISNIKGQNVYQQSFQPKSGVMEIDISNQESGIYFLHLISKNRNEIIKLIKN